MKVFIYILFPNLCLCVCHLIFGLFSAGKVSSDHYFHIRLVNAIKTNRHLFLNHSPICLNEKNFAYPQFFHWVLSFFPTWFYREKYRQINFFLTLLQVAAFNIFLFSVNGYFLLSPIDFLFANIIFHVFPFSYIAWNAKSCGLSARGAGLLLGHIYMYLFFFYILCGGNWVAWCSLLITAFLILITSQFSLQLLLLSLPFFIFISHAPQLLLIPFLATSVFFVIMPRVAFNFFVGQFNHKRNYFKYMAKIFIFRSRPSIYRDFIWDFWKRVRQRGIESAVLYMYYNPVVELIWGFPLIWFVIFRYDPSNHLLFFIVYTLLTLFFLTSFRFSRFMGEPQRYVEFSIPFVTLLFVCYGSFADRVVFFFLGIFIILINYFIKKIVSDGKESKAQEKSACELVDYIGSISKKNKVNIVGNDSEVLKKIMAVDLGIIKPEYTSYSPDKDCFLRNFFRKNLLHISPEFIISMCKFYRIDYVILNQNIYTDELFASKLKLEKIKQIHNFLVLKVHYE